MRQTFAINPGAPGQFDTAQRAPAVRTGIDGGQADDRLVLGNNPTEAGDSGAFGRFLADAMEPAIQRRQQAKFFEGFSKAQSGVALKEITENGERLPTRVFGPTAYEQGAQFYAAQARLNQYANDMTARMPEFAKMTPEESGAALAEASQQLMTGDPFADQLIQQGLLERAGPLMNAVGKARYAYQQTQARSAWSAAAGSHAASLQGLSTMLGDLTSPEDTAARAQAKGTFLASLAQPVGMDDDNYRDALFDTARLAIEQGQFYAVEALREAGLFSPGGPLPDDKVAALDVAYRTGAARALERATSDPEITVKLLALDADVELGRMTSPAEFVKRGQEINALVAAKTGVSGVELLDPKELRAGAKSVVQMAVAAARRMQDRQWQLEDRAQDREWDRQDKLAEEAGLDAAAALAFRAGSVKEAIIGGMEAKRFDKLTLQAYRGGDAGSIANAFRRSGYVSSQVADIMQSGVKAAMGEQYTNDVERIYGEWAKLNAESGGAALAYYGGYHSRFQRFDSLVRGGMDKPSAYVQAFGDPARFGNRPLDPTTRKEVSERITEVIDDRFSATWMPTWLGGRKYGLNESSKVGIASALTNQVAEIQLNGGDLETDALVGQGLQVMLASNRGEIAGRFFWRNDPTRNKPLTQVTGSQQDEVDDAFMAVLDSRLKAQGFSDGANGENYTVHRSPDQNGKAVFVVTGLSPDGSSMASLVLTSDDLRAEIKRKRDGVVKANAKSAAYRDSVKREREARNKPRETFTEAETAALKRLPFLQRNQVINATNPRAKLREFTNARNKRN